MNAKHTLYSAPACRPIKWMGILLCCVLLWCCEDEKVEPKGQRATNELATLSGEDLPDFEMPELLCSEVVGLSLADENGNLIVDDCGGKPCGDNESEWGRVELLNSKNNLFMNLALAQNWVLLSVDTRIAWEEELKLMDGLPRPDTNWLSIPIEKNLRGTQILFPLDTLPRCFELAGSFTVARKNKNGSINAATKRQLWLYNAAWNDTTSLNQTPSPGIMRWCAGICPPTITEDKKGDCVGCEAAIETEFSDCDTLRVSSCKDLTNVILVFEDCSEQRFEDLESPKGVFAGNGPHAGKSISHAYVKSGCFQGPKGIAYGRRFNAPCKEVACGEEEEVASPEEEASSESEMSE